MRIDLVALCCLAACGPSASAVPSAPTVPAQPNPPADRSVVIMVWDGLRPDAIDPAETPNLASLRAAGVEFTDNHSTYPTFTMMNSASLATGAFPDATGYYGNVLWQPGATGNDAAGKPVDFAQPVFTEDYAVLDALKRPRPQLLLVDTLFAAAQTAGMATLAVGKNGAAYLQDNARGGMVVDERTVLPRDLATGLLANAVALPATTPNTYPDGMVLPPSNGNPIEPRPTQRLKDGVSADPTDEHGSAFTSANEYLVHTALEWVLPAKRPRLTLVWLREPDSTQHTYSIGSPNWHDAIKVNDRLLGEVLAKLEAMGTRDATDVIVVSDHGHSNVSGPQDLFPLRAVRGGAVAELDPRGHSVSGMVRLADLLRRAGFTAFDGLGCTSQPVAMGIRRGDAGPVYPVKTDSDGSVCGKPGQSYQIPPYKVPAQLPPHALVVAVNGGSDYIYVPDHDTALVQNTVRFLQERAEVGAIFVDSRHGAIAGTMPLTAIHAQNAAGKNPDIILSYDYDENAVVGGVPGTEMAGMLNGAGYRGMHGSFSPRDVHNTLIASGPDFKRGFKDPLPTGNVDVAPTIARILGLALPRAQGRALLEALTHGAAVGDYRVTPQVLHPGAPATGLTVRLPTDPDGKDIAPKLSTYSFELHTKQVAFGKDSYTYFDFAKAQRR